MEKLLKLGADPTRKSKVGSALSLAQNMADGAAMKQASHVGEDESEIVRSTPLDRIVRMLREYRDRIFEAAPAESESMFAVSSDQNDAHGVASNLTDPGESKLNYGNEDSSLKPSANQCSQIAAPSALDNDKITQQVHALPLLDPDWLFSMVKNEKAVCRTWKKKHHCYFQNKCKFVHVQQPWRHQLDDLWQQLDDRSLPLDHAEYEKRLHVKNLFADGRSWWTAGYDTSREFNLKGKTPREVVYAEGGSGCVNAQGVSWYSTKKEALQALKKTFIVSKWAAKRKIVPDSVASEKNSQQARVAEDEESNAHTNYYGPRSSSNDQSKRRRESERQGDSSYNWEEARMGEDGKSDAQSYYGFKSSSNDHNKRRRESKRQANAPYNREETRMEEDEQSDAYSYYYAPRSSSDVHTKRRRESDRQASSFYNREEYYKRRR